MSGIEQPIQAFSVPSDTDVHVGAEGGTGGLQVADGQSTKGSALDTRVLRPRNACLCRNVRLAKTAPHAKGAQRTTDPERIHSSMVAVAA